VPLAEVTSLRQLHEAGRSRIIDDLATLAGSPSEHTQRILAAGYRSSYTCPLYARGNCWASCSSTRASPGTSAMK